MNFAKCKHLFYGLNLLAFLFINICLCSQPWDQTFYDLNQNVIETALVDERTILSTDRELYLCGETIAFTSLIFDGDMYLPLSLSSVLYVELCTQENVVIARGKFSAINGRSSGTLQVPRTITSDIYYIRAYTNYMKNFGVRQFFQKKLKIINPFFELPVYQSTTSKAEEINCQIFPEGEKLICGIKNRIVCRITNPSGRGLKINARLLDQDSVVLADFQTCDYGLASLEFIPLNGKKYFVDVDGKNEPVRFPLPETMSSGTKFSIDASGPDGLDILVHSTARDIFPLNLVAKRGRFTYPVKHINSPGRYFIPFQELPAGFIKMEIVDTDKNPIAARLLFLESPEKISVDIITGKERFSSGEKIEVTVYTSDHQGLPVEAELSLFTTLTSQFVDNDFLNYPEKEILFAELKQIFPNEQEMLRSAMEEASLLEKILLCTPAGKWIESSEPPEKISYIPETGGDIISGRVTYKNNQPVQGIEILQSFIGKATWIESCHTCENGRFSFLNTRQESKGDMILKVKNPGEQLFVFPDEEFFNEFPPVRKELLHLTKEDIDLVSRKFINIQVEDAFRQEKQENLNLFYHDSIAFYGKEYHEYIFREYFNLPNMKEFIHDIVFGVTVSRSNREDVINVLEENSVKKIGPDPLILIDGVPVADASLVTGLSPEEIRLVRVVRYKYFYKSQIFDGILDIITYSNDASSFKLPANVYRFSIEPVQHTSLSGYPEMTQDREGRIPVYRNLLYWNPAQVVTKDGKYTFSFYAPDNTGLFELRCMGRTKEGNSGGGKASIFVGK